MGKKQRSAPVRPLTRRQISRFQRERRQQTVVIATVASILVLVLAVLGFGYYREFVMRGNELVLKVNDRQFTMNEYVQTLAYYDFLLDLQQGDPQQAAMQRSFLGMQAVEYMIDDEIVRQGTARLGMSASPQETDDMLKQLVVGPVPTDTPVDEAKRQADFDAGFKQMVEVSGVTASQFRDLAATAVLRQKLTEQLNTQVPAEAEQVHLLGIQVAQEDEAKDVADKLAAGQDFATLAKERSIDSTTKEQGGDLGWLPRGIRDQAFDDVAFALAPGAVSAPVSAGGSFYVLKLVEKAVRPLEPIHLQILQAGALEKWQDAEKASAQIERFIDSDKQIWGMDRMAKLRKKSAQRSVGGL